MHTSSVCMGDRFTFLVDDENAAWLEAEADERDRSRAWILNECIRLARSENSAYHHTSDRISNDMHTDEESISDERLDELEERVAELEARIEGSPMALERDARADDGQGAGGAVSDGPSDVENQNPSERAVSDSERSGSEPPSAESVRQQLEDIDVAGRRAKTRKARRDCALWAWEFLREEGTATSSEIANNAFGAFWDKAIGYTTSSRYPGYGLWDNFLRDTLKKLPCVDPAPERGNEWRFDC